VIALAAVLGYTPAPCAARLELAAVLPEVRLLVDAALEQHGQTLFYDPAYVRLAYPGGDVPIERGVCTDVVVRAFRKAGVDLQREVHEDMKLSFSAYPQNWGLRGPDRNIDHRRVPNLMRFFERRGKSLGVSDRAADYRPGDVVAWRLDNGLLHTGLVTDVPGADERFQIAHNIGRGVQIEDVLFDWKILGRYRYFVGAAEAGARSE
jgi:uncharacterized protein